ncbi:MAG: selenide, water dikinase SelD, partial [Candidatus Lokiarchaeota archaeon]|nr:selenide, water dikinase SelD [Candidatus Lokiarchaeota archaeon]
SSLAGILNGMQAFLAGFGVTITKGQSIQNPWLLVGGAASGIVEKEFLVSHANVEPGDVLILTKPVGVQSIMAMSRIITDPAMIGEITAILPEAEIRPAIEKAVTLMTTSNRPVVEAIRVLHARSAGKFKPRAMTDVTGFGIVGHAGNLASASGVDIEIIRVPAIKHAMALSGLFGYPLKEGKAAETAGGMLVAVAKEYEERFLNALHDQGVIGHVVGRAKAGSGMAKLADRVEHVDV